MYKEPNTINEIVVTGRRFRRLIGINQPVWESIASNTEFVEWKIRNNIMMEKLRRRKPKIVGRRKNIMDNFVMTKKYSNFNGRIITDEIILLNDTEIPIKAEWDTGATYSCISNELVKRLGVKPIKTVTLDTSGGQIKSNVYTIDLVLNEDIQISIDVNAVPDIESKDIQCLIGMDIITFGDFAISTYKGETCFSFRIPSNGLIDFTNE